MGLMRMMIVKKRLWYGETAAFVVVCFVFAGFGVIAADAPRAARSVHLRWKAPDGDLFYQEMVVERSVPGSYFMAVGWNTGYFGIQELSSPTNKLVLFSVWDQSKGDNASSVPVEKR